MADACMKVNQVRPPASSACVQAWDGRSTFSACIPGFQEAGANVQRLPNSQLGNRALPKRVCSCAVADLLCAAAQKQGERFLCGRAELIDELETAAPGWLRRRNAAAWVHFLKARPGRALPRDVVQGAHSTASGSKPRGALQNTCHVLRSLFTGCAAPHHRVGAASTRQHHDMCY